jgi:hypothetical protein
MDTTFGLYLPEYTIPAPAVQTNFVKIIGRDGSVDLSNALGLHYDSRTWSLDFKCFDPTVNWHTLSSQVMNAIHGKRLNFEFDDDPNYFWTGRVSVQNYVSNHGTGTLKVTIVSDPFKYAKLSTIVTKTASTGTDYTGALVTFNTANAKINDLSVTMQPIQDLHGYSSPWPAGGGKNKLLIQDKDKGGITGGYNSAGEYVITGTTGNVTTYCDFTSVTLPAGSYVFSISTLPTGIFAAYKKNGAWAGKVTDGKVITLTEEASIGGYISIAANTEVNTSVKIQLEAGSTKTAWSPYSNICPISGRTGLSVYVSPTQDQQDATTYAVDWTDEAGTVYGGTLDVVTGVLTVDRAMVDMGTLNYTYDSAGRFYTSINGKKNEASDQDMMLAISSMYMPMTATAFQNTPTDGTMRGATTGGYVYFRNSAYTDAATFKTAMSGVQLCYELATPITYQLSAQEIEALVGTNNVWSDGGNVTVAVVTPETLTNNGRAVVPTLTASADMVLKWGNYSASVQQGTSTIPQLILENGANLIYIIGTGSISFTWQEASL